MKELVKAQKFEEEYNDAQAYCDGGNSGYDSCRSSVRCESVNRDQCSGWSIDDDDDELLF